MLNQYRNANSWVALPTALSLILSPAMPLAGAMEPALVATTQEQGKVQAAETQPAAGAWPRWFETSSGGTVVMYAPQVESWDGQKHMVFRAAVSYTYKESTKPDLGTVAVEAETKVTLDERLVNFSELTVSEASFPTLARDKVRELTTELQNAMPEQESDIVPRPRPRGRGQEPDPAQEPRRRKGGATADLLEHDARPSRQLRRRADLEPHQGRRFEVRSQHELGRLRAHAHQSLLPATGRELAPGIGCQGTLGTRRQATRELRQAPRRGQLERSEGERAGQEPLGERRRRGCTSASNPRSSSF